MARTAQLSLKIKNGGVALGTGGFNTIDLIGSIVGADEGNGSVSFTATGGGTGSNIDTQILTPTTSGSNITLDLTALPHSFIAIEVVFRNGQGLTPTTEWTRSGNTITVTNATTADVFQVQYTY